MQGKMREEQMEKGMDTGLEKGSYELSYSEKMTPRTLSSVRL